MCLDRFKKKRYFGLPDLIATCQQAIDATSGEYQASINIASLHSLVQQMQSKSTVDFRQAIMVPPTMPAAANTDKSSETTTENTVETTPEKPTQAKEEESMIDKILNRKPAEQQTPKPDLDLPMATDDLWSD